MQTSKVGSDVSLSFFSSNIFMQLNWKRRLCHITFCKSNLQEGNSVRIAGKCNDMMSALAKSRSGVDNINQANLQLHQNCNWVATKKTFLFGAGLNNVLALEQCVIKSPPHMQHWRIVQVRHKPEKAPTAPNLVPVPIEQPFRRTPPWG